MMASLISILLIAGSSQAQTSRNCASPDAEVAACPENYLPKVIVPPHGAKQSVINAIARRNLAATAEVSAFKELARLKAAAKGDPQDGDYVKQLQVVQAATKEKYDLSNDAIRLAAVVYGLTPPVPDFTGDPRASVLTTVKPWLPRYSEREEYNELSRRYEPRSEKQLKDEAAKNQSAIGGAGSVAAARTWLKGEITLFSQAFDNPDDLAVLIYHETSHWVDIAAKPGGNRQSDLPIVTFQSEADAYARSAKIAQQLGRDPTQMVAMAAQYARQVREVGGHDWAWVILHKKNWLSTDQRGPLATVPAGPDAASDDETVLHQKMAELKKQVKENKEHMERLEKERREEDERNRELARQHEEEERRAREAAEAAAWRDRDAAAAECGYTPVYQGNTGIFLWYAAQNELGFLRQPTSTKLTTDQYRIAFLINRACYGAVHNSERNPPRACNDAARLIRPFATEDNGAAKLDAMFGPDRGDRRCLYHIINPSSGITDSASFNKVIAKYQKQLEKERRENDKRWHSGPPRSDEGKPDRGRPPNGNDKDYFWDPGCECWVRRY